MSKPIPQKLAEDMAAAARYKPTPSPIDRIFDDSVERAMFDDILSSNRRPGSAAASKSEDFNFHTAIIKRLREAEQDVFNLQKEHARLKHYTSQLHAENEELKRQATRPQTGRHHSQKDVQLARENKALRTQVEEMEKFLADYGLNWAGFDHRQCSENPLPTIEPSRTPEKVKATPSKAFTKFAHKVDELNAMIRSEPTQIVTDGSRARFVHAAEAVNSIKVAYYRNGLMVKRGPFRYNDSESYKLFVRDIIDGYFPSELQGDNPDGVIIDLVDKSLVDYSEGTTSDERLTGFQLLKRLPKQIVRNGEIIDIAGDIAEKIGHGNQSNSSHKVEDTKGFIEPILKNNRQDSPAKREAVHLKYDAGIANRESTPSKSAATHALPISLKSSSSPLNTSLFGVNHEHDNRIDSSSELLQAVVQVKCGNGGPTFVLKMPEDALISELRKMIADYFANDSFDVSQVPKIELRSAFPPRVLTDGLTMVEAGLVPNGTIHAKLVN